MELGAGGGSGSARSRVCALRRNGPSRGSDALGRPHVGPVRSGGCGGGVDCVQAPGGPGLLGVAFGALSLVVVLVPYRLGARWAWYALWLVPVTYGAIAARQLSDQYAIGYFYAALAVVAGIGLLVEIRRTRQSAVQSGRPTEG